MTIGEFAGLVSLQAVLAGLAGWLGKVSSERIARDEQAKLNDRLRRVESALEAATHVTKAQYDREFEIYRELWVKMVTAIGAAAAAPAIKDVSLPDEADHRPKQLEILRKAVGEFAATVQHNRPFYADEVYRATEPISQFTSQAWAMYELGMGEKEYAVLALRSIQQVIALQDQVREAIRNRMREISTVQPPSTR